MNDNRQTYIALGIIGIIACILLCLLLSPIIEEKREVLDRRWDSDSEEYKEIEENVEVLELARIGAIICGVISGIGLIVVSAKGPEASPDGTLTQCPYCKGRVAIHAVTCPHCGGPLVKQEEKRDTSAETESGWKCKCGRRNQDYISTCACGKSKHDL